MTGSYGLKYEDPSTEPLTEYSFSVWFRLHDMPWDVEHDMMIVQFAPDAFYCEIQRQARIMCRSDKGS